MKQYIIGDIHGCFKNLVNLCNKIKKIITKDDKLIFLGDYIDRGPSSFEVIEYLVTLSKNYNTVFLKGNHEDMLLKYLKGEDDHGNFLTNGGRSTLKSYKNAKNNSDMPDRHKYFFQNLKQYYKTDDFIAVHAGLNPNIYSIEEQSKEDILWIRDSFYRSERIWDDTVIFGHTPSSILCGNLEKVYFNDKNNIIGIDTGACYGGVLSCLRWPDKMVFQG